MKFTGNIYKVVSIVMAIVFLGFAVLVVCISNGNSDVEYVETMATIVKVNRSEENSYFKVEYTIDDTLYSVILNGYDSSYDVGDIIPVKYELGNPENVVINTVSIRFLPIIVPTAFCAVSLFLLISVFSKKKNKNNQANHQYQVLNNEYLDNNMNAVNYENIAASGEMATYHFHFSGKLNQGHSLDDLNGVKVCEAELTKFRLFGASDYDFINYKTSSRRPHTIGKTLTVSSSINQFKKNQNSYFKFDDVNIWQYLEQIGITVDYDFSNVMQPVYIVKAGQYVIGKLTTTNNNFDVNAKIGIKGFFIVEADEMYIDRVFLAAVAFSRTDLSYNFEV